MTHLTISNLRKTYRGVPAIENLDLDVKKGEFFTILGPSGCGKSTTLRCIAGLEIPDQGEILLDGKLLNSPSKAVFVPPQKRRMGFVPQSYATWPHLTVFQNVEFGLKLRRVPRDERLVRVMNALKLVELEGLEKRYPTQLSGGQQQRVALARALVIEPEVLLLDEPLSNLDAVLRQSMRHELKSLQKRLGITAVYVTHDQGEAMVLSDRIAVMKAGRLEQVASPFEIYEKPANAFVAGFIGAVNLLPCNIVSSRGTFTVVKFLSYELRCKGGNSGSNEGLLVVRPERIEISEPKKSLEENEITAVVRDYDYLGSSLEYHLDCGGLLIRVHATPARLFERGSAVSLIIRPEDAILISGSNE